MTKPIPLIRVSNLLPFVDFLEKMGTPTEKLLRQCKLPIYALDEPNALISRHHFFTFVEKAAYQEGIPNLGFLVGKKTSLPSFGALGSLVCQSMTLYDAISTVIKLGGVFNAGERYYLIKRGEKVFFAQEYFNLGESNCYHASHFSVIMMTDLIQRFAGKSWFPSEIWIQSPKTCNFAHHPLSQAQIHPNFSLTAIAFPASFLSLSLLSSVDHQQQQKDYENLKNTAPSLIFAESLAQVVTPLLREGYPSIELAAEIAQMSVRTLQRRLTDEGLTYSQLIAHLRYDRAVQLLQDSSLKIIEISQELGYEDPAHFTRAFKRWTGVSPRDFRHFR
jgi:AraC-like DNA-binding protein